MELALGLVTAALLTLAGYLPFLFLSGFGAVHAPAAVILFVKRARGAGRS